MKNKFICLLMIPILFLLSCEEECDHLGYTGQDAAIVDFSLNKESVRLPLNIYADSIVLSVAADFNFNGLSATVVLSEGAKISPIPSTVTDWSKNMEFTVTAPDNMTGKTYKYIVHIAAQDLACREVIVLRTQEEVNAFGAKQYKKVTGVTIKSVDDETQKITDLSSLNTIEEIDFVHITDFYGTVLKGFENLKRVTFFEISNDIVESVFLDNLEEAGSLLIGMLYDEPMNTHCTKLKFIFCPKLREVNNDLILSGAMESFEHFSALEQVGGEMGVTGNAVSLKGFEKLTKLNYLTITGYNLVSLEGLSSLKTIKRSLTISFVNLTTLNGLNLKEVGALKINNATKLTDITALKTLTELGSMSISGVPNLADLEGLHNIKKVEGNVTLAYMASTDLDGLRNLESVGGDFAVRYCTQLQNVTALNKLTRLKSLDMNGMPKLESLMGLHNVEYIHAKLILQSLGSRAVGTTPAVGMFNLDGLSGLQKVNGQVSIISCPNLTDYCAIGTTLAQFIGVLTIAGNGYNPKIVDFQAGRCSK